MSPFRRVALYAGMSPTNSLAETHADTATVLCDKFDACGFKSGTDVNQGSVIWRSVATLKIGERLRRNFASGRELGLGPV